MIKQESRSDPTTATDVAATVRRRVTVETAARLHIGFMDLNFSLGRRFGSLGFAIDAPVTRIEVHTSPQETSCGPDSSRARRYMATFGERIGTSFPVALDIREAIPAHSGLGSGTQMALSAGHALTRLAGKNMTSREIASMLGRGGRSGIGIATFDHGGIVLDAGKHRSDDEPPPVVWRHAMPEDWRFVLVFDRSAGGVHGEEEKAAFRAIDAMAEAVCGEICRLTLMQIVPSVIEGDVRGFGSAVTKIQAHVGDYFAPWQGGSRFFSPRVAAALAWMEANGAAGIGQSSWGPTGYAVAASLVEAERLAAGLRERLAGEPAMDIAIAAPLNRGARINVEDDCLVLEEKT